MTIDDEQQLHTIPLTYSTLSQKSNLSENAPEFYLWIPALQESAIIVEFTLTKSLRELPKEVIAVSAGSSDSAKGITLEKLHLIINDKG